MANAHISNTLKIGERLQLAFLSYPSSTPYAPKFVIPGASVPQPAPRFVEHEGQHLASRLLYQHVRSAAMGFSVVFHQAVLDRRRSSSVSLQTPRRTLVRSNSSLLGSFKNFVAAPFARLFTGNANEFDDPNDFSGKRRMLVNQHVDNNDIVEDGPAPAKRMRVRSPEPLSPPPRSGYLDPPGSANHCFPSQ
ncbi:hypothetical protein BDP27DRAFT_1435244 [Rhodocollybia butyracea]|uniref:Uncharacterized protein n=1 Tax=Rhodocollybia butyracea TaxID=206335 RepID=A0A9P5TWH9_9AGAR|nr:hypothetical protein BDP27DRAFT_1435244 [Rhodocollybia butyracea]